MNEAMVRVLRSLGHDPAAVWARPAMGRTMPGLLVTWRDADGRPTNKVIRFYTRKELRRRGHDASALVAYEAEMKRQEARG